MKTQINFKKTAKISGFIVLGILLGWLFFGGSHGEAETIDEHIAKTHTKEQGQIVYTCVMHPQIRESEPGNCPICGMELVPVNETVEASDENSTGLTMSPVAMKLADVETTPVVRKAAVKTMRLPGKIRVDERRLSVIPANFSGRVEELYVNFTGAYVQKGDPLASVYSPKIVTAQKELLQAYKARKSNPALFRAAKQKLKNMEISAEQINQIIQMGEPKTNFMIRAGQSGYVLERNISVGEQFQKGMPLFKIADLSKVWVVFQAYEAELGELNTNDEIRFSVKAYSGRTFKAAVTYINPVLNKMKRTVSVRAEVSNEQGLLKPGMLAHGIISTKIAGGKKVLQIPQSAVLWTGKHSVVYVKESDSPTFKIREVVLGPDLGNNYVIKKGLEEGELVVVQGNFMIDAATQLGGMKSMMNPDGGGSNIPDMPE